jgi:glycosyltransferase involved in cell wall biosynthesis
MAPKRLERICIVPRVSGVGGMVSFRQRLAAGLAVRGVQVCDDLADAPYQAVLVIGGTRQVLPLWQLRQRGMPVIQRLDGMNWLHRLHPGGSGWRHYLRAEYGNRLLAIIRERIASYIIYQSVFARDWWERVHGATRVSHTVIHNGIDLEVFTPIGQGRPPQDRWRILMVEGSLMGGYEQGLQVAVELVDRLRRERQFDAPERVELMVVGRVPDALKRRWDERLARDLGAAAVPINWAGLVDHEHIPQIQRSAHLLYSADINPACPNAVIEALACGLPVVSFNTGALPELVVSDAGRVVPYGGDPWRVDPPDVQALARASIEILNNLERFRRGARARAEAAFGLDAMVQAYMQALEGA